MLESNLSADLGAAETDVGRAFARLSSCFAPPWDRHLSEKLVMLVRRSVQALLPTRKPVDPDYLLSSVSFSLCCLPRSKLENMRRHNCEHCGRRAHRTDAVLRARAHCWRGWPGPFELDAPAHA